jgi:GT2 family glycosyltransferase
MYDIVVANYVTGDSLPIVLDCLASVRKYSHDYRLILVDNGSPAFEGITLELSRHRHVICVRNQTNLGFIKATNQGLRLSTAQRVVLLNNDTLVAPQWLETMDAELKGSVGIVGPRSNRNGTVSGELPYRAAMILLKGSMLVFFCVMMTREVIDRLGFLDEGFGVGLGDDNDYCRRAQAAGFDLCYLGSLTIQHWHKTTFRQLFSQSEIAEMGVRAERMLVDKAAIA